MKLKVILSITLLVMINQLFSDDGQMSISQSEYIPTNLEQFMLELINRARSNPVDEVDRLKNNPMWRDAIPDLNEGMPPNSISTQCKPPLVFNFRMIEAARKHSQWQMDNDKQSHYGPTPEESVGNRLRAVGYFATCAETIARSSLINSKGPFIKEVELAHSALFIDHGVPGRGHRGAHLDYPIEFREIGIGIVIGIFDGAECIITTQNLGRGIGKFHITGVAYNDNLVDKDNFYTPGEGLGNITIKAVGTSGEGTFITQTWSSGGYNLEVPNGKYNIRGYGVGLNGMVEYRDVIVNDKNVKLDFIPDL